MFKRDLYWQIFNNPASVSVVLMSYCRHGITWVSSKVESDDTSYTSYFWLLFMSPQCDLF